MPKSRSKRDSKTEPIAKNIKLDLEQKVTLPDEVWLKIMSYLKARDLFLNVALVCKNLNNLTLDGSIVRFLEVRNISSRKIYLKVMEILKNSRSLIGLDINLDLSKDNNKQKQKLYYNNLFEEALISNSKLKSLKLKITGYSNAEIDQTKHHLKQYGMKLEHLQIEGIVGGQIFDNIINLQNLRSLTFRVKNALVSADNLISLAKNCTNLEIFKIDLSDYKQLFDVSHLIMAFDTFFMERQSTLKSFAVENVLVSTNRRFDMLRNLGLCQQLEEFESDSPTITQASLRIIFTLPNLKKLIFKNLLIDSKTIETFLSKLSIENLECLVINDCISYLPKLKKLMLKDLSIDSKIFWNFLSKVKKQNLQCLVIKNCSSFDLTVVKNLPNMCFPNLERVFIGFHYYLPYTENIFVQMKKKNPSIKSIMIEDYANSVSNEFCLEMSTKFDLLICWLENASSNLTEYLSHDQHQKNLELFLWKLKFSHYENYMKMKKDLTEWCHKNEMGYKTPKTWGPFTFSPLPISSSKNIGPEEVDLTNT